MQSLKIPQEIVSVKLNSYVVSGQITLLNNMPPHPQVRSLSYLLLLSSLYIVIIPKGTSATEEFSCRSPIATN